MNPRLRQAFNAEMKAAVDFYTKREFGRAFEHLETAHVLGQRYVVPHVTTHYWMLRIGMKRRSLPEVWGQFLRIVLGALGSAFGIVPVGNTGGTNINMFKRLPVDPCVKELIE